MRKTPYLLVCGLVFAVVACGHLARLTLGWNVSIAGWLVPYWVSVPGVVIPGALSAWGLILASRASTRP